MIVAVHEAGGKMAPQIWHIGRRPWVARRIKRSHPRGWALDLHLIL